MNQEAAGSTYNANHCQHNHAIIESHGLRQTVCKEEEEEHKRMQPRPPVLLTTRTDSVQRRGGIAHMEVAEAACIAHGLLDHMHGLIHGLAPLLLALCGHICIRTSTKVNTRLEISQR